MMFPSFLEMLFGSLAVMVNSYINFRPITLRHQVSLVLPFGTPVDPGRQMETLDAWRCATIFRWFCLYRQSGNLGHID
jgi:hypothetical protein